MRRKAEAELLLLLVALLNVGIFSSTVIDSPVIQPRRQCVGSVKAYQVLGSSRNVTITGSKLRVWLPESVTLTAEGNCCWEVFRRPRYKSTSTVLTSSHGDLVIQHRVRSVRQVPCHQLATVSWVTASAGLLLVFSLTAASLAYRRVMRGRDPGDSNNNNNNNSNNNNNNSCHSNQEAARGPNGLVKDTQISVISESYA